MPDVVSGYKWELYNVAEDYSQANDLAATMPDKLMRCRSCSSWKRKPGLPLDNSVLGRVLAPSPTTPLGNRTRL
jgi:arylsulfatase